MLRSFKWECKKAVHAWGYYLLGLLGILLVVSVMPESDILMALSITLVFGCIFLMLLPMYNVMLLLKEPSFIFEKLRRKSGYDQLFAKLLVNGIIAGLMLMIGLTGNVVMERFVTASNGYFNYELSVPVIQAWFEMAIFFPIVFLSIYYWIGRISKGSHGILSGILGCGICGAISRVDQRLWIIMLIEAIVAVLFFYLLGKWIAKAKEPYV